MVKIGEDDSAEGHAGKKNYADVRTIFLLVIWKEVGGTTSFNNESGKS